ncbi:peptidoglycan/xylan/chitin deacetylase (PgdA/CDA1 family) [Aneurinibacillus soli]|uniref:Peptidoglycan-N-acetylglucosamine deacetylase n=1 Tax=Aneurinibacillus soli TaxID=1500254 RepID=A0A0U4WC60_9BACL|nr:polysaccharide deacetylase family protein [Aneurinibacillus soli]PYE60118.1 peptidoglycan/xylan/chitin deacetylase (PgdA/CDA1 family) [Aneurinibacillus soli]BAU26393.1 Peptidoglycan-N-acetylglucosamine deacetylase [Aneurinibacillus soli]
MQEKRQAYICKKYYLIGVSIIRSVIVTATATVALILLLYAVFTPDEKQTSSVPPSHSQSKTQKIAYLTFDDGPSANTRSILRILAAYDVQATFFVTGKNTASGRELYRLIRRGGHSLGLHSYSHNYRHIYSSPQAFQNDFVQLDKLIHVSTGYQPDILRFPGGSNNHVSWKYGGKDLMMTLAQQKLKEGYQYFDWNVDSTDASVNRQKRERIVQAVLNGCHGKQKAIILMHDSPAKITTVQALPQIIEGLRKQGFTFAPLTHDSFTYHFILPSY